MMNIESSSQEKGKASVMNTFDIISGLELRHAACGDSKCYAYAVSELVRLLGRMGVAVHTAIGEQPAAGLWTLQLGNPSPVPPLPPESLRHDGYRLKVCATGIGIEALSPKGVLNAVYDLAERLGFVFLLPGEENEWVPRIARALTTGIRTETPRFPHRGVFWQSLNTEDFSVDQWLRFYAKLRFNALAHEIGDRDLAEELGLRLEIGGHGLARLLPRDLFAEHSEQFRMFQPEDFGGKRNPDSNFCVTHPATRRTIKENFKKQLADSEDVYAIHAWADDLPAGGWCLCPSCRAFAPEDQSMLATNLLADAVRETGANVRIPMLAYHDTMSPGRQIDASPETCLLFAPRERCYGHALDDPSCARNRFYLEALIAWQRKYDGIGDNHTFEYYFDQILFRGMYPFLPGIIIDDMRVYQKNGIETHLSLQVGGPAIAPEYNMLTFSKALWNETLSADDVCCQLAEAIAGQDAAPWFAYLQRRAAIFTDAMRMCEHDPKIYLDYRWLPETTHPFGNEMAETYKRSSDELQEAAATLVAAINPQWSERLRKLAETEARQAEFEAAELAVMHLQQKAVSCFAEKLNTGDEAKAEEGCVLLEAAVEALKSARAKAVVLGLPEKTTWYFRNINPWLSQEFSKKIALYR
jgi:hypothetical protein